MKVARNLNRYGATSGGPMDFRDTRLLLAEAAKQRAGYTDYEVNNADMEPSWLTSAPMLQSRPGQPKEG